MYDHLEIAHYHVPRRSRIRRLSRAKSPCTGVRCAQTSFPVVAGLSSRGTGPFVQQTTFRRRQSAERVSCTHGRPCVGLCAKSRVARRQFRDEVARPRNTSSRRGLILSDRGRRSFPDYRLIRYRLGFAIVHRARHIKTGTPTVLARVPAAPERIG